MQHTPRAALYARVSDTNKKKNNDPWHSLPRQVEDLRDLAKRWGFAVALEADEKISGAKADRPGWERVLAAVRAGEVDVICAVAFDRLTRSENLGDFEALKRELRGLSVRLVTCKQGEVNLSGTADAEMLSDVQAVWAKGERLKTRERTMAGREAKARAGGYTGGAPPYGYGVAFDGATGAKSFPVNEAQAEVVRRIFREFLEGRKMADINRDLNAEGVPAPGQWGKPGTMWRPPQVRIILSNPTYIGKTSWKATRGELPSGVFAALVSQEVWDEAQERLELLKDRGPRGGYSPRPLSGILKCPTCGVGMGFQRIYHAKNSDRYACRRLESQQRHLAPCPAPQMVNAALADATVLAYLQAKLPAYIDADALDEGVARQRRPRPVNTTHLERSLAKARQRQDNTITLLIDLPVQDPLRPELQKKLADYRAEIDQLEAQLIEARKANDAPARARQGMARLRKVLPALHHPDWTDAEMRELFDVVIKAVTLEKVSKPYRPQDLRVTRLELRGGDTL